MSKVHFQFGFYFQGKRKNTICRIAAKRVTTKKEHTTCLNCLRILDAREKEKKEQEKPSKVLA